VTALTVLALVASTAPARSATADGPSGRRRDPQRQSRRSYRTQPADAGSPARFVAEVDGQIVVVSAETGRIQRRLTAQQPGGGADSPAVTTDGRTVWFTRVDGTCDAHIASVPVAGTEAERKLAGSGEAGAELFPLPRPGHAQLAYARYHCNSAKVSLVVGDLRGVESHGQAGFIPVAWSRDGARLLAVTTKGDGLRLLDVNDAGAVVADHAVKPADPTPGCSLNVLGFSPDDNGGYVAVRRCGAEANGDSQPTLVLLDRNGTVRQTVIRLARGEDFGAVLAFDQSGHSLLFSTVPAGGGANGDDQPEGTLWLSRDGNIRLLARQNPYRDAVWVP
jgi:hypothetical protein